MSYRRGPRSNGLSASTSKFQFGNDVILFMFHRDRQHVGLIVPGSWFVMDCTGCRKGHKIGVFEGPTLYTGKSASCLLIDAIYFRHSLLLLLSLYLFIRTSRQTTCFP